MAVGPATLARPAPVEGRPVTLRGLLEREGVFSWLMLAPGVLFLLAFVAYPFFYGMFLSLSERRVAQPGVFVGLANFATMTQDAVFWQVTRNTFVYTNVLRVTCQNTASCVIVAKFASPTKTPGWATRRSDRLRNIP